MLKIVETDTNQDLESRLNKQVVFMCFNYIYTGVLTAINDKFYRITNPHIIYETGKWTDSKWKDCQSMGEDELDIMVGTFESWFVTHKTP